MTIYGISTLTVAALFGVWWLAFPRSVIAFYTWFHRDRARMPDPSGVRLAGLIWLGCVAVLAFFVATGVSR